MTQEWKDFVPYEDKMENPRYARLVAQQLSIGADTKSYGKIEDELDAIEAQMLKDGPPATVGNAVALGARFIKRKQGHMFWEDRVDHDPENPLVINNVLIPDGHYWQRGEIHAIPNPPNGGK